MKKLTMMLMLAATLGQAYAQKVHEDAVPAVVKAAFAKAYPSVKSASGKKKRAGTKLALSKAKKKCQL